MPGTWQPIANQPAFNASTMLLLTDGTVMCQDSGTTDWWRLTPDEWGDYANGTWSPLAPMTDSRLYYASAVLADGRVFVAGGEYHNGIQDDWNRAEMYDPVANTWHLIATPGWTHIGDAPCCVLPDGHVLLGSIDDIRTAIYNPKTDTWTPTGNKADSSSEEGFTLLPDGTVLAAENSEPAERREVPDQRRHLGQRRADAAVPGGEQLLHRDRPLPAAAGRHRVPDRRQRPHRRLPPGPRSGHARLLGRRPRLPGQLTRPPLKANDAPGCVLPNGHVLCVAGTAPNNGGFAVERAVLRVRRQAARPGARHPATRAATCSPGG